MQNNDLLSVASFVPERMVFPNCWCGHLPFAFWLVKLLKASCLVELGTHTGNSYLGFCEAVKASGSTTRCYAVDTWKGDEHASFYEEEVYEELYAFHTPRYSSFSTLIRATFDEALEHFADKSINLLHIDGLHTYDAVKHDFETWLPKLAPGAIVLFHDIAVYEREFGVWKLWDQLCARYPYHMAFNHSHGLGVLQISDTSAEFFDWLIPGTEQQSIILNYFTGLGESMLERYRGNEQSELVQLEREQVNNHWKKLEELQSHIEQLEYKIVRYRKVLAPLLFFKYLINGNFSMAINMLRRAVSWMARCFRPGRTRLS